MLIKISTSAILYAVCAFISCKYEYPSHKTSSIEPSFKLASNYNNANNYQKFRKNETEKAQNLSAPIVLTNSGYVEGFIMKTIKGREIYAFEGIPYGENMGGENRFENPKFRKPWKGILSTKKHGPKCLQLDFFQLFSVSGSEDCLYLNVYTPKLLENSSLSLATLVFIHGGSWYFGAGSDYGPSYLLDHGRDVILVTLNYRLGIFGFLSTFDENMPGNLGQKDQVLALKWIQANIRAFGGDPNRVTIAGQSAGAASVHFHMMSSLSKGLFSQAISMSGTGFSTWAVMDKNKALEANRKLSKATKCPLRPTSEFVKCLKNIQSEVLVSPFLPLPIVPLGTVIEPSNSNAFLTESPNEAYLKNKVQSYPYLVLKNSNEMELILRAFESLGGNKLNHLNGVFKGNGPIRNWLGPIVFDYGTKLNKNEITREISKFYFSDSSSSQNANNILFSEMLNDGLYGYGIHKTLINHSKIAPTYSWIYSYRARHTLSHRLSLDSTSTGVSHNEELPIIFNMTNHYPSYSTSDPEFAFVKLLTSLISNFVTFGEPLYTDDNENTFRFWDQVEASKEIKVLSVDNEIKMVAEPYQDRFKFWESLNLQQ